MVVTPAPSRTEAQFWRRFRYGLLAALAVLVIVALNVGTLPSSMGDLDAAIAAGRVNQVSVAGVLPPGAGGYTHVEVTYRDGAFNRLAELWQASDAEQAAQAPSKDEVVVGDVAPRLRRHSETLEIITLPEERAYLGLSTTFYGMHVPTWLGVLGAILAFCTLVQLIQGPEPWWGTRWAWFWFMAGPLAVVTVPLFLLISGPPPGIPEPPTPGRRLRGIWAFLLSGVVASVFGLTR